MHDGGTWYFMAFDISFISNGQKETVVKFLHLEDRGCTYVYSLTVRCTCSIYSQSCIAVENARSFYIFILYSHWKIRVEPRVRRCDGWKTTLNTYIGTQRQLFKLKVALHPCLCADKRSQMGWKLVFQDHSSHCCSVLLRKGSLTEDNTATLQVFVIGCVTRPQWHI